MVIKSILTFIPFFEKIQLGGRMKGAIFDCFYEAIKEKYGEEKWVEVLTNAGFTKFAIFLPYSEIPEEYFSKIKNSMEKTLNLTEDELFYLFSEYWVFKYAPKNYPEYYKQAKNAREFILLMDSVHKKVTEDIPYSKPPHFEYQLISPEELIITYYSVRNLLNLAISLIKAVGKYYNEDLEIEKISENKIKVRFKK